MNRGAVHQEQTEKKTRAEQEPQRMLARLQQEHQVKPLNAAMKRKLGEGCRKVREDVRNTTEKMNTDSFSILENENW